MQHQSLMTTLQVIIKEKYQHGHPVIRGYDCMMTHQRALHVPASEHYAYGYF